MPGVTKEQIAKARDVDLLSYLQQYEPTELKRDGSGGYRTVSNGSLVYYNSYWYWNRGGYAIKSALDYLVKVRGIPFVDAVETLCDESFPHAYAAKTTCDEQTFTAKKPFKLPQSSFFPVHVMSYLGKRGIDPEIICRCIQFKLLFESKAYHNCVFVGRDEQGKARFACQRGTDDDYKNDVAGSDKRYSFWLPSNNESRHLAVFESPTDALSHWSLQKLKGYEWDGHRLSLGGTSAVALISFLERHPEITRVILHLDNDHAGLVNALKIKAQLKADERFLHIRVSVNPPRGAKDYNEKLQQIIDQQNKQHQRSRQQAAILI